MYSSLEYTAPLLFLICEGISCYAVSLQDSMKHFLKCSLQCRQLFALPGIVLCLRVRIVQSVYLSYRMDDPGLNLGKDNYILLIMGGQRTTENFFHKTVCSGGRILRVVVVAAAVTAVVYYKGFLFIFSDRRDVPKYGQGSHKICI